MSSPPKKQLPPESIVLVAKHLHHNFQYGTLCSLLCANRAMFAIVAPIILGDPCSHHKLPPIKLITVLLRCVPVETLPEVLQIAFLPETLRPPVTTTTTAAAADGEDVDNIQSSSTMVQASHLSVNYLSYMNHFHFSTGRNGSFQSCFSEDVQTKLNEYAEPIRAHGLYQYSSRDVQATSFKLVTDFLFRSFLPVTLTWTLCEPVLEQIRSLDIPLSDIARYITVAHRFKSLEHVKVILDMNFTYPLMMGCGRINDERNRYIAALYEGMATFVEMVRHKCGDRLCRVECPDYTGVAYWEKSAPSSYLERIMRLLPPLSRPVIFNRNNWVHFLTYVDTTCLDHVHTIQYPSLDPNKPVPDEAGGGGGGGQGLMPLLKRVQFVQTFTGPSHDLDDIAFAFADTLEELQYRYKGKANIPTHIIGSDWRTMPRLRDLDINIHGMHWSLGLFAKFPAIESVHMKDSKNDVDVVHRVWDDPVHWPHLKTLFLSGSAAHIFNMNTLAHSPLVECIQLDRNTAQQFRRDEGNPTAYDPEAPNSPLQWSWNWHLPHLTTLSLEVGFSCFFQFRMLGGCPMLKELTLLSHPSPGNDPQFLVQRSEFISRRPLLSHDEAHTTSEYILCSALDVIRLEGPWVFSPEVLAIFLNKVAPNASGAILWLCLGFDAADCVRVAKGMKCLRFICAIVDPPNEQECEQLEIKEHPQILGDKPGAVMFQLSDVCYASTFSRVD
ncbi:hypothetical protein BGZ94_008613 [Podila epigama]|nr:hypothetical protein BGZ94_008613 [Podila epigama]